RGHLEAIRHTRNDFHRLPAGEEDHVGITHPIRGRDDDLVPRVQCRDEGVVQYLLAAGANRDLAWLVVEAVLTLELFDNGVFELGDAIDVRVLRGLAALDRGYRRPLNIVGRIKIRLTGAQPDDVAAGQFERAGLVRDGYGCRRLDALELVRHKGHRKSPVGAALLRRPCRNACVRVRQGAIWSRNSIISISPRDQSSKGVPIADLRTNRRKSQGLPPARTVTVGSNPTRRKI